MVPSDSHKGRSMRSWYQYPKDSFKGIWKVKAKVMPVVVGALRAVIPKLGEWFQHIQGTISELPPKECNVRSNQNTAQNQTPRSPLIGVRREFLFNFMHIHIHLKAAVILNIYASYLTHNNSPMSWVGLRENDCLKITHLAFVPTWKNHNLLISRPAPNYCTKLVLIQFIYLFIHSNCLHYYLPPQYKEHNTCSEIHTRKLSFFIPH